MNKRIRALAFRALCEIAGKVGQYGHAIGSFGASAEMWAAEHRDKYW